MADDFDVMAYIRSPKADVPSALTLAAKLIAAAPKVPAPAPAPPKRGGRGASSRPEPARADPDPVPPRAVIDALDLMIDARAALALRWDARDQSGRPLDLRPMDNTTDTAWGAVHDRIDCYARLPADLYPNAAQAAELLRILFPGGKTFLALKYDAQWAEMDKRVNRIKQQKLQPLLERIAGEDFVRELLRTYEMYGDAIGATRPKDPRETVAILEPLQTLLDRISAYLLQIVAWHQAGDDRVKAVARIALRPIEDYRAATRRTGGGGGEAGGSGSTGEGGGGAGDGGGDGPKSPSGTTGTTGNGGDVR